VPSNGSPVLSFLYAAFTALLGREPARVSSERFPPYFFWYLFSLVDSGDLVRCLAQTVQDGFLVARFCVYVYSVIFFSFQIFCLKVLDRPQLACAPGFV
jgi:hypothetical protein